MEQLIAELKAYLDARVEATESEFEKIKSDMMAKIEMIKDSVILMEIKKLNTRLQAIEERLPAILPAVEDED